MTSFGGAKSNSLKFKRLVFCCSSLRDYIVMPINFATLWSIPIKEFLPSLFLPFAYGQSFSISKFYT